jgi:Zn-dependent metalloprotease
MTYGDGSDTYFDVTSIDVAGHEMGHAVCENSKFSLPKESGAMNEAFLIFGAHVSNITQPEIYLVNRRRHRKTSRSSSTFYE